MIKKYINKQGNLVIKETEKGFLGRNIKENTKITFLKGDYFERIREQIKVINLDMNIFIGKNGLTNEDYEGSSKLTISSREELTTIINKTLEKVKKEVSQDMEKIERKGSEIKDKIKIPISKI